MKNTPREHHFYVAIAKFLFHHPERGIVSVRDPIRIKEAEQYGLSPLILYGLTVARLPIRWMTFTLVDQPRAFRDVLLEAWRNAEGLRGRPDILLVNRHLAAASPELVRDMTKIGVQVEVADARDRSLSVSLRSAQYYSGWRLRMLDRKDQSLAGSIQARCQNAQDNHDFFIRDDRRNVSHEEENRIEQWLALPVQEPVPELIGGGLDWKPGPWLSSWEKLLPPNQPRYFDLDGVDGETWLLTGEEAPEDIVEDDDDNMAEIAKDLVACWPNSPAEVAKCAGITLQKLKWFTSGKATLDQHARLKLEKLIGIEFDERTNRYIAAGPYILMAQKPQAFKEVYERISGGGNARPYEILPYQGKEDPNWRYVFINAFYKPLSMIMAPRGKKITENLPDLLMNYDGIKRIAPNRYRDVVSTCTRACREPAANVREMKDFVRR